MSDLQIEALHDELDGLTPQGVLAAAHSRFGARLALASSLGPEDQALLHMASQVAPSLRAFTLDTGRLHPQTYDLLRDSQSHLGMPIDVYFPEAEDVEEMVRLHGIDLFRDSVAARKRCCDVRKVRPLKRALAGVDAWVTGLRSEQSPTRESVDVVSWDEANGLLKISPLASWSEDDVWAYIREHDVPVNALHANGYRSIGCAPCTRATLPGEDVRAGRWSWESAEHKECGLHSRHEDSAEAPRHPTTSHPDL